MKTSRPRVTIALILLAAFWVAAGMAALRGISDLPFGAFILLILTLQVVGHFREWFGPAKWRPFWCGVIFGGWFSIFLTISRRNIQYDHDPSNPNNLIPPLLGFAGGFLAVLLHASMHRSLNAPSESRDAPTPVLDNEKGASSRSGQEVSQAGAAPSESINLAVRP